MTSFGEVWKMILDMPPLPSAPRGAEAFDAVADSSEKFVRYLDARKAGNPKAEQFDEHALNFIARADRDLRAAAEDTRAAFPDAVAVQRVLSYDLETTGRAAHYDAVDQLLSDPHLVDRLRDISEHAKQGAALLRLKPSSVTESLELGKFVEDGAEHRVLLTTTRPETTLALDSRQGDAVRALRSFQTESAVPSTDAFAEAASLYLATQGDEAYKRAVSLYSETSHEGPLLQSRLQKGLATERQSREPLTGAEEALEAQLGREFDEVANGAIQHDPTLNAWLGLIRSSEEDAQAVRAALDSMSADLGEGRLRARLPELADLPVDLPADLRVGAIYERMAQLRKATESFRTDRAKIETELQQLQRYVQEHPHLATDVELMRSRLEALDQLEALAVGRYQQLAAQGAEVASSITAIS